MGKENGMYKERTGVVVGAPVLCSINRPTRPHFPSAALQPFAWGQSPQPFCPSQRRGQRGSEMVGVLPAGVVRVIFLSTSGTGPSCILGCLRAGVWVWSRGGCRELVSSVMAGGVGGCGHFSQGITACGGGSGLVGQYLVGEAHSLPFGQHGGGRYPSQQDGQDS